VKTYVSLHKSFVKENETAADIKSTGRLRSRLIQSINQYRTTDGIWT
jgi:hypothetical protein